MGTRTASSPQDLVAADHTAGNSRSASYDNRYRTAARARHQQFGLLVLGGVLCVAAPVFTRWDIEQGPGRWFWPAAATMVGVVCLVQAQRRFGGVGADRNASPYYGIFAGVTSGAVILTLLTVEGWVLLGVLFAMMAVMAFMAWIEQSTIGMTAALCVAVLAIGHGMMVLDDPMSPGFGSLAVGLMLIVGAAAVALIDNGSESRSGTGQAE